MLTLFSKVTMQVTSHKLVPSRNRQKQERQGENHNELLDTPR